jgi:chromate transport protein ChrA
MIASSVLKLSKSTLKGPLSLAIFAAVLILAFLFDLPPVVLIVAAGIVGFFFGKGGNQA